MPRYRRSRYFYVAFSDQQLLDLQALLCGELRFTTQTQLYAISALAPDPQPLSREEVDLLARLSADRWLGAEEIGDGGEEALQALAQKGLLISDADGEASRLAREREERLVEVHWDPRAANYHFAAKQPREIGAEDGERTIDLELVAAESAHNFESFVETYGAPPPALHQRPPTAKDLPTVDLPRVERRGGLYEALAERRTVRAFDRSKPLRLEELDSLLYYVFGCHGRAQLAKDVAVIKRTSPSGGALHPIEAYPLLIDVEGAATGIYHYDAGRHGLTPLRALDEKEARELAVKIAGGQSYAGENPALVVLTARFERNFWKYRENLKTYSVVMIDAGHLSQTFYLVAEELGLGAYFSAAVNAPLIEEILEIDGISEGALAICGCGRPAESELGLDYGDFEPDWG